MAYLPPCLWWHGNHAHGLVLVTIVIHLSATIMNVTDHGRDLPVCHPRDRPSFTPVMVHLAAGSHLLIETQKPRVKH